MATPYRPFAASTVVLHVPSHVIVKSTVCTLFPLKNTCYSVAAETAATFAVSVLFLALLVLADTAHTATLYTPATQLLRK